MRVRIIFSLINKGAMVPFHHQYLVDELVLNILKKEKNDFEENLDYNFSGLKGQTRISKKGLHFYSSRITIVFSSYNDAFIQFLLDEIFKMPSVQIGELELVPESVEKEEFPSMETATKYLCISPIVLLTSKLEDSFSKRFISPTEDTFSDFLYESTMQRMEKSGLYTAEKITNFFKFQFAPDIDYLNKIKATDKKFARIYNVYEDNLNYEIRGYTLPFTLFADAEVQEFVLNFGLGAYTNKGYGMLDLVESNKIIRVPMYEYGRNIFVKNSRSTTNHQSSTTENTIPSQI